MLEALNRWGQTIHRYGDNSEVSGISRDFTSYPVDAWAPHDGGTILFLGLDQSRGRDLVEALWVDGHMLRDLQVRDQDLASGGEGMLESETPSLEVDDPFDEESERRVGGDDPFGFEPGSASAVQEKASAVHSDWGDIGFGDDGGTER